MDYVIGQNVSVLKLNRGYWMPSISGTFLGVAKNGRIKVKTWQDVIKCYAPENVRPK